MKMFHELTDAELNEEWTATPMQLQIMDQLLPQKTPPSTRNDVTSRMYQKPMRQLPLVVDALLKEEKTRPLKPDSVNSTT